MAMQFKNALHALVLTGSFFFFSTVHAQAQRVWFTVTNPNDVYSEISIMFANDATDGVDQYEARKNRDGSPLVFYSKIDTGAFSAQALPLLTNDKTVILGIDASVSGLYLFRLDEIENIDESVVVILEDTYFATFTNLRVNPDYLFSLTAGIGIERFHLHFYPPVEISAINGACDGTESSVQLEQGGSHTWDYVVKDENDLVIDAATTWNGVAAFTDLPSGTYAISLTDPYGYTVVKQTSILNVEPVVAQFQVSDSVVPVNNPVYFFDYSIGAYDYLWDFGDGNVLDGVAFPSNIFSQPGIYNVQFIAYNNDCNDVSSKTIHVVDAATGIEKAIAEEPVIYASRDEVFVKFPNQKSKAASVEIFNLMGQRILSARISSSGEYRYSLPRENPICFVRLSIEGKSFEKKIFLQ